MAKAKPQKVDYMVTHEDFFGPPLKVARLTDLRPADVIYAMYKGEYRYFFVLNSPVDEKLHCLSMRDIPRPSLLADVIAHMDIATDPKTFYKTVLTDQLVSKWDAYRTLNTAHLSMVKKMYYILDASAMVPEHEKITDPPTTLDLPAHKKVHK